jgi:hypothetical protein
LKFTIPIDIVNNLEKYSAYLDLLKKNNVEVKIDVGLWLEPLKMLHSKLITQIKNFVIDLTAELTSATRQVGSKVTDFLKERVSNVLAPVKEDLLKHYYDMAAILHLESKEEPCKVFLENVVRTVNNQSIRVDSSTVQAMLKYGDNLDNFYGYPVELPIQNRSDWIQLIRDTVIAINPTVLTEISCEFVSNLNMSIVSGAFVSLSDNHVSTCFRPDTAELLVFALHTITVDKDIKGTNPSRENLNIALISPNLMITKLVTFDLIGKPGVSINPPKASPGVHGVPGKPGGYGGSFYGVANKTFGTGSLNISAHGGLGGPGQHGGDSMGGSNGINPSMYDVTVAVEGSRAKFVSSPYDTSLVQHKIHYFCRRDNYRSCANFQLVGSKGVRGGPPGNGGKYGRGGHKGYVEVVSLSEQNFANIEFQAPVIGSNGPPGVGGMGSGNGGEIVDFIGENINGVTEKIHWLSFKLKNLNPVPAGINDRNEIGWESPALPNFSELVKKLYLQKYRELYSPYNDHKIFGEHIAWFIGRLPA